MIRIGSQVDLVLPLSPELTLCVQPGDRVRAGELVDQVHPLVQMLRQGAVADDLQDTALGR